MEIPDYEQRLDQLFCQAFSTNDPAMLDWVQIKFELKTLRNNGAKEQANPADAEGSCEYNHSKRIEFGYNFCERCGKNLRTAD